MAKLKVYVWEEVFRDYTTGIAFAIAENSEQARDLVEEQMNYRHDDLAHEPKEIDLDNCKPQAFYVYGGG